MLPEAEAEAELTVTMVPMALVETVVLGVVRLVRMVPIQEVLIVNMAPALGEVVELKALVDLVVMGLQDTLEIVVVWVLAELD